jgi:tripartite-type tricarboxylate transporter receptor subunit TctC
MNQLVQRLFVSVALFLPCVLWAQAYPERPVRVVVSYSAGATNDIVARAVAQRLSVAFKQNFFVENKVGGNGTIGAGFVAKEPADGYNLLLGNTSILGIHPSLFPSLSYDPVKDFQAVSILAESPTVLVVNAAMPVRTVKELVAYSKANPKSVAYGSPGTGTPFHLSGELFNSQTGTSMLHVPYKGAAPAVVDLLGGQIQVMFDNLPNVLNHIRSGKLRALVVTSDARLSQLPEVPTMAEAGLSGAESSSFFAFVVAKGTPASIVQTLSAKIAEVMRDPAIKSQLSDLGAIPVGNTPAQATQYLNDQVIKWTKVVKASGAKADL